MQRMMGLVRRCIEDYRMIEPGDRIAVGVSGGKDSLTLDLSADSTVRTVSLTGDVVAALAGAKNGAALPCRTARLHSTVRR